MLDLFVQLVRMLPVVAIADHLVGADHVVESRTAGDASPGVVVDRLMNDGAVAACGGLRRSEHVLRLKRVLNTIPQDPIRVSQHLVPRGASERLLFCAANGGSALLSGNCQLYWRRLADDTLVFLEAKRAVRVGIGAVVFAWSLARVLLALLA